VHKVLPLSSSNRRNNSIEQLVVNGTASSYQFDIRGHIVQFYDSLFIEQFSWRPRLDGLTFNSIGEDEAIWLEKLSRKMRSFEVVKALNSDKASRLDSFTMAFFQACGMLLKWGGWCPNQVHVSYGWGYGRISRGARENFCTDPKKSASYIYDITSK
jgi:hypothetical protein